MNSLFWDRRNRLVESRVTATNALLGGYVYNERGLRVKAERNAQPTVQVVAPNGGESLYLGAPYTITWNSSGPSGTVKLELLVGGSVAGTIAENLPGAQTSYQWAVGQISSGWVNPGTDFKVRITSNASPVTEATYYFYDNGGKLLSEYDTTGTCVKDYFYLGGKMIGEYQPAASTYYYYASDQINSTRLVTDSTGVVVRSAQYDPYGGLYKTWVDTYHPKPGFSGKEREAGTEMDYFGARYYGHRQYVFMSAEPKINREKALTNPQFWNLYNYCGNSPISNFDPDGNDWLEFTGLKVNWYAGDLGNKNSVKMSLDAVSGQPKFQNPDAQHIEDSGPIPEGDYSMDLNLSGPAQTTPDGEFLIPGNGIQSIPNGFESSWGQYRIRLEPVKIKEGYIDRDNFYLHTSNKGHTSGCIETKGNNEIVLRLMESGLKKIEMRVDYKEWRFKLNN